MAIFLTQFFKQASAVIISFYPKTLQLFELNLLMPAYCFNNHGFKRKRKTNVDMKTLPILWFVSLSA